MHADSTGARDAFTYRAGGPRGAVAKWLPDTFLSVSVVSVQ
jgi:hypothetical protein